MARDLTSLRDRGVFRDEEGVTTVGMAVSLMLCLALLFSGAQAYRLTSASAEVQEVADVCALAAENEVAEFMVAVRLCDATVLSMTLLAATVLGIGVVTAFIPPLAPLSEQLVSIGTKVVKARDKFSDSAKSGLDKLQRLLPFLAAANSFGVAKANDKGAMDASYFGIGVLVPQEGDPIASDPDTSLSDLAEKVKEDAPEIRQKANEAEDAAEEATQAKQEAYAYDCGNSPGHCQFERAGRFSWMPESANPYFASVDAWSFQVALDRAREYYARRLANEAPASSSVSDVARCSLYKRFLRYASEEVSAGYVRDDGETFEASFPKLYRNVQEFKATRVYSSWTFPVGTSGEGPGVMHAYDGCPELEGAVSSGTVAQMDAGDYVGCDVCGMSVQAVGNAASASTNIDNGFEYHYEHIRQLVEKYQEAKSRENRLSSEAKAKGNPLMDAIGTIVSNAADKRIEANPPGSKGAIAIVVNLATNAPDAGFESTFVSTSRSLGVRAAVAGAALVEDTSDDAGNVITGLLDSFGSDGGAAVGAARIVLDLWSGLLKAYENGQEALLGALKDGLDSVATTTKGGLGTWASKKLRDVISAAGLEPANLNALKPAVLNTGHVAGADADGFAVRFKQAKSAAMSASTPSGGLVAGLAAGIKQAAADAIGDKVTIAEIEFPVGDAKIPVEITLPESVRSAASDVVSQGIDAIGGAVASAAGERAWQ